jgi:aminoglycoside phosphotransferase (APT) family kinase protein
VEFTDIKAPESVAGLAPWQDPGWVAEAEEWISAGCARAGLARTGTALARGRTYSVVVRVPTSDGTVWFKASPPAASFEPALIGALANWFPDQFPVPVAVDLNRGWSLTRDGGPTLAQARERAEDLSAWHAMLRGYARLQFELAPHAADLLGLGLADLRPGSVPGQFDKVLADPATERVVGAADGIAPARYQALCALAPRLRDWCAELEDLAIPASLDHSDVHPNNVFAARNNPFDWGDAAVAHPFCSLLIALRTGAEHAALPPRSPELAALADDYLRPWLDAGHPRAAVDRSLSLALRIAPLGRALAWGRVFPCYQGHSRPAGHAIRSLAAMLEPDPVHPGTG